jgi:NTP pyrophosphatase (non-canonical NTP hydrolase)
MNNNEYIAATGRTDLSDYTEARERAYKCAELTHYADGLVTEAAEIKDVFKAYIAYGKPIDSVNVKEELGDIFWYMGRICEYYGWKFEDVQQLNIDKLKGRYPEKFNSDQAINRDLSAEREILEGGK